MGGGGSTVASFTTGMSPAPLLLLTLQLALLPLLLHVVERLFTVAWLRKHSTGCPAEQHVNQQEQVVAQHLLFTWSGKMALAHAAPQQQLKTHPLDG